MSLGIIYILLAIISDAVIFYFSGLYTSWYWWWIPIIIFPLLYVFYFGLTMGTLFLISFGINKNKEVSKPNKIAFFMTTQINHQLMLFSRSRVKVIGKEKIPNKKPVMIIYNHTSNFDPMIIMDKLSLLKPICITKPENKKVPLMGAFIHAAGFISIDRKDNVKGIEAINKAIEFIQKGYGSICVSPEGTRSKTLELLPFHPGTFNIAKRANVSIVVVGIKNTFSIHKNFPYRSTRVEMKIIDVIPYETIETKTTVEICEQTHALYEEYLGEHRNELSII